MAYEKLVNSSAITVTSILTNIVDVQKEGLHEAWLFFNGLVSGDAFDVWVEVKNEFANQLNIYKYREINYNNLTNGTEKAVHFNPVFSSHYRIKIQKAATGINNRDVDYVAVRYF